MGGIHAGHYDALPDSRVVAVLDIRLEAAESLAETYSASAYDNMEKMLAEENIDIVSITTPTPYHKECVLTAAAAGKHIGNDNSRNRYNDRFRKGLYHGKYVAIPRLRGCANLCGYRAYLVVYVPEHI
jgi:hypothetical protein